MYRHNIIRLWQKKLDSGQKYKIKSANSDEIVTTISVDIFDTFTDYARSKNNFIDGDTISIPFDPKEIKIFFDRLSNPVKMLSLPTDNSAVFINYCIISNYLLFDRSEDSSTNYVLGYEDIEMMLCWIVDNYDYLESVDCLIVSTLKNSINDLDIGSFVKLLDKYHNHKFICDFLKLNYNLTSNKKYHPGSMQKILSIIPNNNTIVNDFLSNYILKLYKRYYRGHLQNFIYTSACFLDDIKSSTQLQNIFVEKFIKHLTKNAHNAHRAVSIILQEYEHTRKNVVFNDNINKIIDSLICGKLIPMPEKNTFFTIDTSSIPNMRLNFKIAELIEKKSVHNICYVGDKWYVFFNITFDEEKSILLIDSYASDFSYRAAYPGYEIIWPDSTSNLVDSGDMDFDSDHIYKIDFNNRPISNFAIDQIFI